MRIRAIRGYKPRKLAYELLQTVSPPDLSQMTSRVLPGEIDVQSRSLLLDDNSDNNSPSGFAEPGC